MKKIMELLQNMKAKNEKKDNKGFSLVELIIVIAIMAILVGIVGTQVLPYINKSKEAKDFQIINSYGTAATTAYASNAEQTTAVTTVTIGGTNSDATGMPAATLETEIKSLTGYNDISVLKGKMGSKNGKNITKIVITINPTDTDSGDVKAKSIVTQAYYKGTGATDTEKTLFDPVVTQL